ncbi:MAG: Asp-tRNA(Asn)/Glu-tRNA(Gln) amidotransferase subunit GatA, partial [Clostridia bacterium]|nr:Asp-tRNA(Asn)/Glu-tRNA(Gln) amidotransferase subunit GatA [Clostridia bacterium]
MKIFEAAELLKHNKISPVEIWRYVQKNIDEKNSLNRAYITICNGEENALRVQRNRTESPLWGIPVAIKDNICTKNIRTTAASRMLENFVPTYNATVVDRLLAHGVVITGKTNMDEFGMGSEGKFSAYGQATNPINELFVPGGSSGGSGVSVKSNMAFGALGTDTGGSIRQPAAFCGVYGLKPSYSLVSRYGLIAFASSLDVIGPMAKSAKDCAILLDAIAGGDMHDATSSKRVKENYADNLSENIKGLRIGVPREYADYGTTAVKTAIKTAAENFRTLGCRVEECSLKSLKYA